jgi:hypothetical protein
MRASSDHDLPLALGLFLEKAIATAIDSFLHDRRPAAPYRLPLRVGISNGFTGNTAFNLKSIGY